MVYRSITYFYSFEFPFWGTLTLIISFAERTSGVFEISLAFTGVGASLSSLYLTPSINFIANLVFSYRVIPLSVLIAVAYSLNRFILCMAAVRLRAIFSLTSSSTTSMTLFAIYYFLSAIVCSLLITCIFVDISLLTDRLSLEKSGVFKDSLSI